MVTIIWSFASPGSQISSVHCLPDPPLPAFVLIDTGTFGSARARAWRSHSHCNFYASGHHYFTEFQILDLHLCTESIFSRSLRHESTLNVDYYGAHWLIRCRVDKLNSMINSDDKFLFFRPWDKTLTIRYLQQ